MNTLKFDQCLIHLPSRKGMKYFTTKGCRVPVIAGKRGEIVIADYVYGTSRDIRNIVRQGRNYSLYKSIFSKKTNIYGRL